MNIICELPWVGFYTAQERTLDNVTRTYTGQEGEPVTLYLLWNPDHTVSGPLKAAIPGETEIEFTDFTATAITNGGDEGADGEVCRRRSKL